MSKFIISISLILATLLGGLMLTTAPITASAAGPNTPQFCGNLYGQYINASLADRPCKPCPVDFYCKTLNRVDANGQQLMDPIFQNIAAVFSPEQPGRNGQANSEVQPCPSGTTTVGNTFYQPGNGTTTPIKADINTNLNYPIKVGELASDISFCKTPNFVCPASTPIVIIQNGIFSCQIQCPSGQDLITSNGVKVCQAPSKDCLVGQISYNKTCIPCPVGSIIDNNNGVVTCTSPTTCNPNESLINGKCYPVCPVGSTQTIINGNVSCTVNSSSVVSSSSSSSVTPPPVNCTIPGQIQTYGTCACPLPNYAVQDNKGNKSCTTCPVGNIVTQVGIEQTGEIVYKCEAPAQNNGGGDSTWSWIIGAGVLFGGLCLFNVICNNGGSSTPAVVAPVTPTNNEVYGPVYQPSTVCPEGKVGRTSIYGYEECVCAYGTTDYDGQCGVEINVPAPNQPIRKKATDGADYSFSINDNQLYSFADTYYNPNPDSSFLFGDSATSLSTNNDQLYSFSNNDNNQYLDSSYSLTGSNFANSGDNLYSNSPDNSYVSYYPSYDDNNV